MFSIFKQDKTKRINNLKIELAGMVEREDVIRTLIDKGVTFPMFHIECFINLRCHISRLKKEIELLEK